MDKKMLKRTKVFIFIIVLIFGVLVSRLAYLQIYNYDYYWDKAEKNRLRIMPVSAARGEVFDTHGKQLIANRPGFTVSLVDLGDGYNKETITYLADLLDMTEDDIRQKINSQYYRRYLPIRLKMDVDIETVSKIAEHRLEYPGVSIEVQPIRYYVEGNFAPHILGYLGEGTVADRIRDIWAEEGYDYHPGELVGQTGIELVWEPYLRGIDGGAQVEVNSTGQATREFERVEPIPGNDLYLTLDASLQYVVEEALIEAVEQQLAENNIYAGEAAAVFIDPNNGKIKAMASVPSYDLNTFRLDYTQLLDTAGGPLINKCIEEYFPVGSVFKLVTSMAGLEKGLVTRADRVFCAGSLTRYGATKTCYRGTVHGSVNIVQAITRSCNVFFYDLGLRVGIDDLAYYAREFGFGAPSGLTDLYGEKGGIVASREYKEQTLGEQWYPAETMDAAIGQSFQSITPLQLANYAAMLANGGVHYRPCLVDRVIDHEGNIVMAAEPEVLHVLEAKDQSWEIIREGMRGVTLPGGTASRLSALPVRVAGKTGSAQVAGRNSSLPTHSFFIGYAPIDNPEIAFAILIKYGGTGGTAAAGAAYKILESYFTPQSPGEETDA